MVKILNHFYLSDYFLSRKDYSNYALNIHHNDTGIILSPFQASQFTIMFWFYLKNAMNTVLISLREKNNVKQFEIIVRQNK